MKVISEKDSPDAETIVYGLTVINKTLHGIPDRVSRFPLSNLSYLSVYLPLFSLLVSLSLPDSICISLSLSISLA